MARLIIRLLLPLMAVSLLVGCGSMEKVFPDERAVYKRQKQAEENLEIPPDLTKSTIKDALVIPAAPAGEEPSTYSEFVGQRGTDQPRVEQNTQVLPQTENVTLRSDGQARWLEVQGSAEQVWPKVVEFWRSSGVLLVEENPRIGVMRTDWLENRANIKRDVITETLRKVVDGMYSSGTRDRYQVRMERGPEAGVTEIYLTHQGMVEKVVTGTTGEMDGTVWEPSGSNAELEAEMLQRLMVYMGVAEQQAEQEVATQVEAPAKSQMIKSSEGLPMLMVNEEFSRAWRRIGTALDRIGFVVEDRNRSEGIYYVRYRDPEAEEQKKGFFSRLAFWKDEEKVDPKKQYQVQLSRDAAQTEVTVHDDTGAALQSETATRILTLLNENIR